MKQLSRILPFKGLKEDLARLGEDLDSLKILQGRIWVEQMKARGARPGLGEAECQVFSQFGEDGIIQYLLSQAVDVPPVFVEFGVEDYRESNTRFLLMKDNWRGLVMDADHQNIAKINASSLRWRYDLMALAAMVTRENINELLTGQGFTGSVGLLSIDIDGNDYWVWESLSVIQPAVVVIEYNSVFGPQPAIVVPYDAAFKRAQAHYSHLWWGASLAALAELGRKKGYALVGCNQAGNNAFFVRQENLGKLKACGVREAYVESRFRDSRDRAGQLSYLAGAQRWKEIADCEVLDLFTGRIIKLGDLPAG